MSTEKFCHESTLLCWLFDHCIMTNAHTLCKCVHRRALVQYMRGAATGGGGCPPISRCMVDSVPSGADDCLVNSYPIGKTDAV